MNESSPTLHFRLGLAESGHIAFGDQKTMEDEFAGEKWQAKVLAPQLQTNLGPSPAT